MPRRRSNEYRAVGDAFMRLSARQQLLVLLVGAAAILAVIFYYGTQPRPGLAPPSEAPSGRSGSLSSSAAGNMLLGNPSRATADPANSSNYLIDKGYYVLSYNNGAGTANWVSWRVTEADLGDAPRKRVFDTDTSLPPQFTHVTSQDYTGSGFDRGHLCPHSDRAANETMSFATFVMSNIIPQAPMLNEKTWADLEDYGRDLVRQQHRRLYIIAGPMGQGGTGSQGFRQTIGHGKVTVPAQCWKIMVVVDGSAGDGSADLATITADTRVIAVVMPNDNNVGPSWARYRTTPAEVEQRTGLRFFDALPPDVAQALRQKLDQTPVASPQRVTSLSAEDASRLAAGVTP